MQIITDLQIHSKYARAVSPEMIIPKIWQWAKTKGIGLVATGDWTHPLWMREIKANLEEVGNGLLKIKNQELRNKNLDEGPLFLLATEVSSIYSQGGKLRRIHTLIWVSKIETADKINKELIKRGCNLIADGRPIIGLTSIQVAELVFSTDPTALIIPAHAWTPWFSLYGSESGFDSIDECFGQFAKNIYAIETGLSCYDEKTEVLTKDGWKKFSEVSSTDNICTLDVENGEIEYQNPDKIFQYNYKGKMYRLKTKRVDLLVTPNHNLFISPCDFRKPAKFYLKTSEKMFGKSKRFKKDGVWKGENIKSFVLPACRIRHGSRFYSGFRDIQEKRIPIKAWLKFFGLWLAEGWTSKGKQGDYNICIANKDSKLLLEIKNYLKSFGYKVYQDENIIRVRDYQLFNYLRQFGKAADKFIPLEIKSLSKNLLEIFFEYYIKGDGHIYGRAKKGLSATTISLHLRDDLQEIALKMGISAYYKLGYKKGTQFQGALYKDRIYKQSADSWVVYFIRKNIHTVLPSTIKQYNYTEEWVDFNGKVFCVSVPNRVVYIRRNGIPVWCGNSDPAMNWRIKELDSRSIVSFSDAHSGPKLGREATVFELEELSYENIRKAIIGEAESVKRKAESNEKKLSSSEQNILNAKRLTLNAIAYTIEFYPEEGKYHYTGHRNCGVKQTPAETKQKGTVCPVCGRKLTVGVMHRVEQLAGRTEEELGIRKKELDGSQIKAIYSDAFPNRPPFVKLVPLQEILSEVIGGLPTSQKIQNEHKKLVDSLGGEFNILLNTSLDEITKLSGPKASEAIHKVRIGDIYIDPGYDGVFGKVKIWGEEKKQEETGQKEQMSLF